MPVWNLGRRAVSSTAVRPSLFASLQAFGLAFGLAYGLPFAAPARAQTLPDTGYELALSGPSIVRAGRDARYRGVAYRVRGLAELLPHAGPVRARFRTESVEGAWIDVRPDAQGRFEVAIPIGAVATDLPRIEVAVGPIARDAGDEAREEDGEGGDERAAVDEARIFEVPVTVQAAWALELRTDRNLYEPGEPAHVWLLVRDEATGAPARGRTVRLELEGVPLDRREVEIVTGESGVAHLALELGDRADEGLVDVRATVDGATASAQFRVGRRTWERVFAELELEPEEVAPGAEAIVRVRVTTPDAAPIRGATVDVQVGEDGFERALTSDDGEARIAVRAPAYLAGQAGYASVRAHIAHPAHGSVDVGTAMRVAVPLALEISLIPAHGALVPEIDDTIFVQLEDVLGEPPPPGTVVELEGPAVPGGRARATADENGLAEIAVRLPRGASSGANEAHTTLRAHVIGGPLARTARIQVPVQRAPEVVPTAARPLLEPGGAVEVRLARRASASRLAVVVELLDGRSEPLDVARVAAGASSARLTVPREVLGRLWVRARAVHADESLEGTGASDAILVRPPRPDFVSLVPARERWRVGETAQIDLRTLANGPRAWGALLVRDLAAHGGEQDFSEHFLDRAFEQAILEATGETGIRLVRAALAAAALADAEPPVAAPLLDALGLPEEGAGVAESSPERGVLRDPWPLARELARRGVGAPMMGLEQALAGALESGTLDEITEMPSNRAGGGGRRLRADVLAGSGDATLGGGEITPAMLEAIDPSFTYDAVGRRVARVRLVQLLSALAGYLDPGDDATLAARTAAREPWTRWLQRMVERGVIADEALDDPWGGRFTLRASRAPAIVLSTYATEVELVSPGPDRRLGTADDVRDPFARAVDAGTPYAVASGEDALMRALAVLSPVARTLEAIRAAYTRISAEMTEDLIGDAVHASVSEGTIGLGNIGTIGHGSGGGGYGSGYGSGAGGMSGRRSSVPRIGGGGANLARLVRERFPPTIAFRPEIAIDPSGITRLEIPLADAVTSYRVEVIVWREDGWIWSARAQISSDRDVVIDAPIPPIARVGDRLELPMRVQNRGSEPRVIELQLLGDDTLGVASSEPVRVTVAPGEAAEVPVRVAPGVRGEGSLRVVARGADGTPLDAVRRPLRVVAPARRASASEETLVEGRGELALEVEDGADPLSGRVRLAVGAGLFDAPRATVWPAWSGPIDAGEHADRVFLGQMDAPLGFPIGASYRLPELEDEVIRTATERLAQAIDRAGRGPEQLPLRAWALLGLAPATRDLAARAALAEPTGMLVDRLVREVGDDAVALEDQPELVALSAAALGWSGGDRARPRVAELVRRLERSIVQVGPDVWLATAERPLLSTVLLAMAEISLGHRGRAFALLATLARWSALGHALTADEAGLARAAAARLGEGTAPTRARVTIDGAARDVELASGRAELEVGELARSGRHTIAVELAGSAPVLLSASARFGVPWDRPPPRPGPFALSIVGEAGVRDAAAELELVVVNRSPRWITAPVVELQLPTGAELPEAEHARIRRAVRHSERGESTLTLTLRPLAPGAEVRVPLPVRWSIAGDLRGFGVAAHAADRPDAITVLAPHDLAIAADGGAR